jgi:recombinational DNA repair protein RecR
LKFATSKKLDGKKTEFRTQNNIYVSFHNQTRENYLNLYCLCEICLAVGPKDSIRKCHKYIDNGELIIVEDGEDEKEFVNDDGDSAVEDYGLEDIDGDIDRIALKQSSRIIFHEMQQDDKKVYSLKYTMKNLYFFLYILMICLI